MPGREYRATMAEENLIAAEGSSAANQILSTIVALFN